MSSQTEATPRDGPEEGLELEVERYELEDASGRRFMVDRREFLKTLGGGLFVLLLAEGAQSQQESGSGRRGGGRGAPQEIAAWLRIGEDGKVTVFTGKAEVGQNIRTSLTQAVAEELRISPGTITLVMADTALVPFDMGTFGSRTTPDMNRQLRRAAATAREALIDMAAEAWGVDRNSLNAHEGKITRTGSSQAAAYGALTQGKAITRVAADDLTMPAQQWQTAGTSLPKVNGRAYVTGDHEYASDVKRPGMLFGRILRAPDYGASLASVDVSAAKEIPGGVVVKDGDFVGVAAPTAALAARTLAAIKAQWKPGEALNDGELYEQLKKPSEARGGVPQQSGDVQKGMGSADVRLKATYTVAFIAHAPLEPRAAVAEWSGDQLTVWTGSQRPFGVRSELASALRMPEEKVRVIVPDTGSGYGGKHTGEAAVEAARLAKQIGKPVKITWTREEEFTHAYFRPAGVIEVSSGARKDGTLTAWEFHNFNSGASGIRGTYDIPNQHIEFHNSRSPLRQGSYRGLAATANHFARECHMDEMATALKMDPLELRRKNLKDPRQLAVLEAVARQFGWGKQPGNGRGCGIACGFEKGGYTATCVEIAHDSKTGQIKVARATTAFECGAIVNPNHLKNQIEGAMVMGLGGALYEAIRYESGRLTNGRFSRYRVPRFSDLPKLETILIDRRDIPSAGAGETPIVGIAPAISNAIFAATGIRLRSLPMIPDGILKTG